MKIFKSLLTAGVLLALATGCSTTKSTENMLSAAGFKMMPADTESKLAHLQTLPAGKVTTVMRDGTMYYVYPDKKNNMLYVGTQPEYQAYQKLRFQQQMTEEQVNAAAMNDDAAWGVWGGPVVWGFRR
jgi:hypothetical protein